MNENTNVPATEETVVEEGTVAEKTPEEATVEETPKEIPVEETTEETPAA